MSNYLGSNHSIHLAASCLEIHQQHTRWSRSMAKFASHCTARRRLALNTRRHLGRIDPIAAPSIPVLVLPDRHTSATHHHAEHATIPKPQTHNTSSIIATIYLLHIQTHGFGKARSTLHIQEPSVEGPTGREKSLYCVIHARMYNDRYGDVHAFRE